MGRCSFVEYSRVGPIASPWYFKVGQLYQPNPTAKIPKRATGPKSFFFLAAGCCSRSPGSCSSGSCGSFQLFFY